MTLSGRGYRELIAHYEGCLSRHGDTHRGVDWPRAEDAEIRYGVMLDLIPPAVPRPVRLLDFGCGAGHLLDFLVRRNLPGIEYHGLDLSAQFLSLCRNKYPNIPFTCADVLDDGADLPEFDYIVLNGVFTEKLSISHEDMWDYARELLRRLWPHTRHGLAFNVMSKQVDWERSDLFHLSCDEAMLFLTKELSRHCVIRQDYGLFEYTAYVYREANRWPE